MSYNGSGLFTNPFNWNNDKTNAVKITASRMQTQDDGIATGLSTAICKDGQQTCTALIPFAVGISIPAGTTSAPGCAVIADLTTGMYQSTAGALDFSCSGARSGGLTSTGINNTVIGATTQAAGSFTTLNANSTITSTGGITVNTNKFIVNGSTGALTIAGNIAVNTNKFTVNASSGNTLIAGSVTISPFSVAGVVTNNSSGVLASATALPNGTTATTQSAADNSTKVATTAYVDRAAGTRATSQSTPVDPTGTTNTTGLMMGLAGSITPSLTGNILFMFSGTAKQSSANDGVKITIRYGTGSAPANAAAASGTAASAILTTANTPGTNSQYPYAIQGRATGLTLSTAYWYDIQLASASGGTASIGTNTLTAMEV